MITTTNPSVAFEVGASSGPGVKPKLSLRERFWRTLKIALTVPFLVGLLYALFMWAMYLTVAVFTSDRWNYVRFHLSGAKDTTAATEPLWKIIAPAIGDAFPGQMFEAASVITLALVLAGMRLNRFPWPLTVILAFSPGITYFLTGALRQGFALGVFMILLSVFKKNLREYKDVLRWWVVMGAAIPAILIHNAIIVGAVYVLVSLFLLQFCTSPAMSQRFQLILAVVSILTVIATPYPSTTSLGAVALQVALCVGSFRWQILRAPEIPLIAVFLMVVAAGFTFTITGLRVLLMVGLLAPLVIPRFGMWVALLSCVVYPFVQFGLLPGRGTIINRRNGVVLEG